MSPDQQLLPWQVYRTCSGALLGKLMTSSVTTVVMTVVASSVTTIVTTMTVVASPATPVASPASSERSPAPLVSKLVTPTSRAASVSTEVLQRPAYSARCGQILLNILRSHKTCTCQAGGCLHLPSCSVPWSFCLSQNARDDARAQRCFDICSPWLWATNSAIAFPPHCMSVANVPVTMQECCKPCGFLSRLEAAG